MKNIIGILILVTNSILAQNGTPIYSYGVDMISTKSEFIAPFIQDNYINITPYRLKYETAVFSPNNNFQYSVKLLKYNGWEGEPGFANVLEITNESHSLILKNVDGWRMFSEKYSSISSRGFFLIIPLNQEASALVLQGWRYGTGCAWLTIVVLYKNDIQLVFNKEMDILNIKQDTSSLLMNVQSNLQDFRENGVPFQSAVNHSIWLENGILKFRNN